ncbi:DUF1684 domain-containing protein [Asanoa sp. NPDC049573]|uniref:DUF1684 domain-containing protein n=1 Tax=Asanoa sp. NPDC049573 TaxID=3155396 RepID=UPI00342C2391
MLPARHAEFEPAVEQDAGVTSRETIQHSSGKAWSTFGPQARRREVVQQPKVHNPSCAYDDRWACPLAPEENRLAAPIEAGELNYH